MTTKTYDELRDEHKRLRLTVKTRQLERANRLLESSVNPGWVDQYVNMLDRYREGQQLLSPITSGNDRRHGSNFPLYESEQELNLLRAPARILVATNPYATGLMEGLTSYTVGPGYTYRASAKAGKAGADVDHVVKAAQDVLDGFVDRTVWGELEQELFWRSREDGDAFLRHGRDDRGRTWVRTVEPEQVTQPPGSDESEWRYGIRTGREDVQHVEAYWVSYLGDAAEGEEVPAAEITHWKVNAKRSIKRGMTDFSFGAYDALDAAGKLRRNLAEGAAVQAAIAGVRQHEAAALAQVQTFQQGLVEYSQAGQNGSPQQDYQRVHPGMMLDVPKGMQFVPPPGAANASAHVEVLQACLRGVSVKWNAPEWLGSADASNNNFASSLTAESPFVLFVLRQQGAYKRRFLRTMRIVLQHAADAGVLPRNVLDLIDVEVEAPSPEARNQQEEAERDSKHIEMGVSSPQIVAQELGHDYEQVQRDLDEHAKRSQARQPQPQPGQPGAEGQGGPPGEDTPFGDDQGGGGPEAPKPPTAGGPVTEGRWVTIGAHGGGEEESRHGGTPVYIGDNGVIEKGPKHLVGRKPGDLNKAGNARHAAAKHAEAHPHEGGSKPAADPLALQPGETFQDWHHTPRLHELLRSKSGFALTREVRRHFSDLSFEQQNAVVALAKRAGTVHTSPAGVALAGVFPPPGKVPVPPTPAAPEAPPPKAGEPKPAAAPPPAPPPASSAGPAGGFDPSAHVQALVDLVHDQGGGGRAPLKQLRAAMRHLPREHQDAVIAHAVGSGALGAGSLGGAGPPSPADDWEHGGRLHGYLLPGHATPTRRALPAGLYDDPAAQARHDAVVRAATRPGPGGAPDERARALAHVAATHADHAAARQAAARLGLMRYDDWSSRAEINSGRGHGLPGADAWERGLLARAYAARPAAESRRLREVRDATGHEHGPDGRFGHTGGGAIATKAAPDAHEQTRIAVLRAAVKGAAKAAAGKAGVAKDFAGAKKVAAARFARAGFDSLPMPARRSLSLLLWFGRGVEHMAMTAFRDGRRVCEQAARERGASPEQAARVARLVGVADLAMGWTVSFPLVTAATGNPWAGKAASWLPVASAGYVAYSTLRNPMATLRAARKILREEAHGALDAVRHPGAAVGAARDIVLGKRGAGAPHAAVHESRQSADDVRHLAGEVAQRVMRHGEWYEALFAVAFDRTHDARKALAAADSAVKAHPSGPADSPLSPEDVAGMLRHDARPVGESFDAEAHPRGQPENAGEFAPKGGAGGQAAEEDYVGKQTWYVRDEDEEPLSNHAERCAILLSENKAASSAVKWYTGKGYEQLNATARNCPPDFTCLDPAQRKKFDAIEKAIAGAPEFSKPVMLFRGMDAGAVGVDKFVGAFQAHKDAGSEFTLPSLTSTSSNPKTMGNESFGTRSSGVVLQIKAKTGLAARSVSRRPDEEEVIQSSATRYKVTAISDAEMWGGVKKVVYLEEI